MAVTSGRPAVDHRRQIAKVCDRLFASGPEYKGRVGHYGPHVLDVPCGVYIESLAHQAIESPTQGFVGELRIGY